MADVIFRKLSDRSEVSRFTIPDTTPERSAERTFAGALRNMRDDLFLDMSAYYDARRRRAAANPEQPR